MRDEIILPRDNVLIWLGSFDNSQVNNVLILNGGDVLILKAIRRFDLNQQHIRNDILNMDIDEFVTNYNLLNFEAIKTDFEVELDNNKEDLEWKIKSIVEMVKEGVRNKKFPPYIGTMHNRYFHDFNDLTQHYLSKLHNSGDPDALLYALMEIRKKCEGKIKKLAITQLKEEEDKLEKLKQIPTPTKFSKLIGFKKEINRMVDDIKNKIKAATEFLEEYKKLL